jgi:hypothetical protein
MYLDNTRLLISETSEFPGSHGDSCANTSRDTVLMKGLQSEKLHYFFTEEGQLRHPSLYKYVDEKGNSWSYDDFSVDQWVPLYIACSLYQPHLASYLLRHLKLNWYRTGDGKYINPLVYSSIKRGTSCHAWYWDLPILAQALILKLIPFRWSDSEKRFESARGSSADYLNWFMVIIFAVRTNTVTWPVRLAMKVIGAQKMLDRVESYCLNEPNSDWILEAYEIGIKEVWGKT